jgi:hypothetical protein
MYKVIRLRPGDRWPEAAWATSAPGERGERDANSHLALFNTYPPARFKMDYARITYGDSGLVKAYLWAVVWEDPPAENEFGLVMP